VLLAEPDDGVDVLPLHDIADGVACENPRGGSTRRVATSAKMMRARSRNTGQIGTGHARQPNPSVSPPSSFSRVAGVDDDEGPEPTALGPEGLEGQESSDLTHS